jgi:hypothetical protein
MCIITNCPQPASSQSRKGYCAAHAAEAKTAWLAMVDEQKATRKARDAQFEAAYNAAHAAAVTAWQNATPEPMTVAQHESPLDDTSRIVKAWHVSEGVCGFGAVYVKPGTHAFVHWCKHHGHGGGERYYGGCYIAISWPLGQSYERNSAAAYAAADVLREHGIPASAECRLD